MQASASFLLWIAGELEELRPWLAPFFRTAMNCGSVATVDVPQCSAKFGWKLLAVGSSKVQSKEDLMALCPERQQRVWLKWGDRESKMVVTTTDATLAAKLWLRALAGTGKVRSLIPKPQLHVTCAGDTQASKSEVGYGGWTAFRLASAVEPIKEHECIWFQERAATIDFPLEFECGDILKRHITCFETLAQIGLVYAAQIGPNLKQFTVVVPSLDDNQPSESAINRLFTTARPLCYFIQALAALASELRIKLVLSHIQGKEDTVADGLSRSFEEATSKFDSVKRIRCPPATRLEHFIGRVSTF